MNYNNKNENKKLKTKVDHGYLLQYVTYNHNNEMLCAILFFCKTWNIFIQCHFFKKAHFHTAKRYRVFKTSIRTFFISIGCVQSYVNICQTNIFKMPIITLKKKLLNEVKMYLKNSSIYFSVKGREFFVFLYLHFFSMLKRKLEV